MTATKIFDVFPLAPEAATPVRDLDFIRRIMEDSRRAIVVDAAPFLVWGALVVTGTLLELLALASGRGAWVVWTWMGLIAAGWAFSLWRWRVARRRAGSASLAERALGSLWVGCLTAMSLIGFVGFFAGELRGPGIVGSLAVVMGTGYYATAALTRHGGIRTLGLLWWGGGAALYFVPAPWTMPVFATLVVLLQILPGLVLRRRFRRSLVGD